MMTGYGLQLYSVRDAMKENMEDTVRKVAALGYKFVEPAGFFDRTAEQFNALMAETGLKLSGTHSSWTALRDDFENTLAFHKAIGNKRYIIPGADLGSMEKIDNFCKFINEVQPKLAAEGIELQYHNHSHEFMKGSNTGVFSHYELQKKTNINFEIDTYWVYRAGLDPIEVLESLKGRVNVIHVKDGTMEKGLSLGLGTAPVAKVVAYAKANGIDMVVESEDQEPDGISEVTRCIEYLKTLG